MIRCTEEHGQPMNLIVREGHRCYVLQQSRTKSLVNYVPALYSELPFYACAGGKVLMSELPISLVEKLVDSCDMEPLTPYTIIDPDEFWLEVRKTAKEDMPLTTRESSDNGSCISVPVRDSEGNIIAALSFSGFVGIKDTDELLSYLPVLKEASEEITRNLFQCWAGKPAAYRTISNCGKAAPYGIFHKMRLFRVRYDRPDGLFLIANQAVLNCYSF